jgi:hypothetical protein
MSELVVLELDDLLEGRHRPGLHRLADDSPATELAGVLGAADWRVLAVALDETSDKGAVLAGFAAAGQFPDWAGRSWADANWDALQDALRDLSWFPAAGYVVLVDGWDAFAAGHRADADVLGQVLLRAAEWWADAGTPFHALLRA